MQQAVTCAASRDDDIAELLRTGCRDRAFEILVKRYGPKIHRLCYALLRDGAQAEDATQESLVRIWKSLHAYGGQSSFSSWIYTITRNRCLTLLERRKATDCVNEREVQTDLVNQAGPTEEVPDGRSEQLLELVNLLPERLRRVLLLYYFEERSTNEVALMLGCPEGTVKTHLYRARAALAEQLRKRGLNDPTIWLETTP